MKYEKSYQLLKVAINDNEKEAAKIKARTQGQTLQGYLGSLVLKDLGITHSVSSADNETPPTAEIQNL